MNSSESCSFYVDDFRGWDFNSAILDDNGRCRECGVLAWKHPKLRSIQNTASNYH